MFSHEARGKNEQKNERGIRFLKKFKRWQAIWALPNGKIVKRRFPTKTLALLARESARTKILENRYLDKKEIKWTPFEEAVQRFLDHSEANVGSSLLRDDRRLVKRWLASPLFAGKTLDQINTSDIERYKQARIRDISRSSNRKVATPVSKRLVDFEIGRLKRLFHLCLDWDLCDKNPAAKVKLFRADVNRVRYLLDDEEARLLEQAGTKLAQVIRFALNTGMRKGEILGLRWHEVDQLKRIVTIPGTKAKGKRDRHIPLNNGAIAVLSEIPRSISRDGLVFINDAGGRHMNLHYAWRQAVVAARIEDFRFHDLRHTFASRLVSAGVDLAAIRDLLGHQDFKMTLRYAHLAPSRLTEAVAVLDEKRKQTGNEGQQGAQGAVG